MDQKGEDLGSQFNPEILAAHVRIAGDKVRWHRDFAQREIRSRGNSIRRELAVAFLDIPDHLRPVFWARLVNDAGPMKGLEVFDGGPAPERFAIILNESGLWRCPRDSGHVDWSSREALKPQDYLNFGGHAAEALRVFVSELDERG